MKYFGGTNITIDRLKEVMPTINVDGTTYKIEKWLEECAKFDALEPGKSKLWIPYGVWEQGTVTKVEWSRHEFKHYSHTSETEDWWIAEPFAHVQRQGHEADGDYYVYEISFYKRWRRKTHMKHLIQQQAKPKRKFLSSQDIAAIKRDQVITNSKNKKSHEK